MNRIITSIAATAALLISGQAFAQATFVTGQAPFDHGAEASLSSVQRAEVRLQAANAMPTAGELTAQGATELQPSTQTRAEVRQATRDALKNGLEIATGENA